MEYSHNFGSNFPDSLIPAGTKKDVDNTIKNLITQYYAYIDNGNIKAANTLYSNNKNILEDYIINLEYINRLEEELFNIGISALKKSTNVIGTNEPLDQEDDGYWYKDYWGNSVWS